MCLVQSSSLKVAAGCNACLSVLFAWNLKGVIGSNDNKYILTMVTFSLFLSLLFGILNDYIYSNMLFRISVKNVAQCCHVYVLSRSSPIFTISDGAVREHLVVTTHLCLHFPHFKSIVKHLFMPSFVSFLTYRTVILS